MTGVLEARRLVLDALGERPRLQALTVDPPGPGEVRVRMLAAGLAALERLWELRKRLPREEVPPVATPAWLRHLEGVRDGDWEAARAAAREKLADPAA